MDLKKITLSLTCVLTLIFAFQVQAQVPTNGDCFGAIPVCQSIYTFNSSASGHGNYTDLPVMGPASTNYCPNSCISQGEQNTTWYIFTTQSTGLLNFTISPVDGADDYDWAVYNITTNDCSAIYSGGMQVSCNYCLTAGTTGPNGGTGYWCEGPDACSPYNAPIPVTAGSTYVLMVDNYTGSFNGYTLNFSASTASIVDNTGPQMVSLQTPIACGASQLTIAFSENINCSSISGSDFSITGPGGPYTISYVAGPNCLVGGTMENNFTLTVIPSLETGGSFSLNILNNAVTDVCGNTNPAASLPFTITAPNVTVTPSSSSYCVSGSVNLSASGATTYTWSPSTGLSGTTGANVTASPSITTTYTVAGVLAGCTDFNGATVTVNPLPSVSLGQNPTGAQCAGSSVTLNASSSITGTTYAWSGGGTGSSKIVTPASTTTYTVTGTSPAGCSNTSAITVTINPLPVVSLSAFSPVCINAPSFSLSGGSPAGGSYTGTGVSGGSFDPATAGIGPHTITYTYTNGNGCTNSAQQTLTVNSWSDASINASGPYCVIDPAVTLTAVNPGGSWSGTGITNSITGAFDPAIAGIGPHTITYIISGSCPDTGTVVINVTSQANATITAAGPYCESAVPQTLSAVDPGGIWSGTGITDSLSGIFDPSVAGIGIHTIIYSIGGNCADADTTTIQVLYQPNASINAAGPYCNSDAAVNLTATETGGNWSGNGITNSTNGTFDPGTAGVGTHTITYIIAGTCPDTAYTSITVNSQANATITPAGPFCDNESPVTLVAADNGGVWSGTGISDAINGTFSPSLAGAGSHLISYYISGSCGDSSDINLTVFQSPTLLANGSAESCMGKNDGTAGILITGGTNPYYVLWNNSSTEANLNGLAPGLYTVLVTDGEGCTATAFYEVDSSFIACEVIIPHIYVPNIFSPNDDGVNDILYVRGQGITEINFSVYDRWGEELFNTKDMNTGWDGTYKGKRLDPAVYIWHMKATLANGEFIEETGNVSLTR